ncbi:hypothetical protein SASPL_130341 [Salvia splendens]|uniref:NAC domain-containing protein n=1 Tax=Salvia splendens TaxID=180675 RepID=A0A8X8ZJJ5_SALSN|nr:hypothetical protein SASPL_130341 [Salvia splendens]
MSCLSSVEAKLPPGFRFHPKDEELICDYLLNWITGGPHPLPLLLQGRAPKGQKTEWVMHEFRLEGAHGPGPKSVSPFKDWVLCRVFFKSRSETPARSEEAPGSSRFDVVAIPSSPPLTDPFFPFDAADQYNHEQVPCFSILNNNQTNPNFSILDHMDPPPVQDPSSCDKTMIKAVLNHLTKMESESDDQMSMKGGSLSFEADSYLSEVVWNSYS